ncbi:MAG: hypothetical protein SPH10_05745 [Candidatus Cryptobacteroides sp.]|nr:hypothetical protein [Candidatus Cryptobacteroides sp.]
MGNIDGKSLFGLLSRIESIKAEISALESELKSLVPSSDLDEDFGTQTSEPIDITIPEIDMGIGLDAPVLSVPAMAGEEADLKEEAAAVAEDIQEASAAEPEVQDIPEVTEAEVPAVEDIPEAEDAALPAMEDIPEEPETTAEVEDIPAETGAEPVAEDMPAEISATAAVEDIPAETGAEPAEVTPVREMAEPTEGTAQAEKTAPAAETEEDDLPFFDDVPAKPARPVKKKTSSESGRKAIVDSITADAAVMDVMAEQQAWRTDRAGSPVKNVISAISLNDRVLLINILFKEDPLLFQDTIAAFNSMSGFEEAVTYVKQHFPEWDLNSDPVYRLMMAVRRKFS